MTGDPRAFKQIVLNLVSNAIKFTERGGTVTASAGVEGARLVLRVTDTGVGIAADDLKRIGDPFFQAGKTYQRRHEGTGLGLSIVKSLVAMHGGEMNVQSRVGEGTTVTVALPLVFVPPTLREPASNIATLTPGAAHRIRTATPPGEEKCLDGLTLDDEMPRRRRRRQGGCSRARRAWLLHADTAAQPEGHDCGRVGCRRGQRHHRQRAVPAGRPSSVADVRQRHCDAGARACQSAAAPAPGRGCDAVIEPLAPPEPTSRSR